VQTFYVAPQPLWVSRPARADLAYNPDGTTDLSALHASPRLRAGQAYQVRSSISVATADQLRAAGTDYPRWVANRYLQLPPTITPRTRELARQVAAGLDNPYDIAIAVTDYLRAQISYADTTPSLDSDQEPLDWFLFDLRQGFCNYYASAEIVLLRSLGIPARLAVGFAQGTRQKSGLG
jgi:transglutaminase-like putative cysteine protease